MKIEIEGSAKDEFREALKAIVGVWVERHDLTMTDVLGVFELVKSDLIEQTRKLPRIDDVI